MLFPSSSNFLFVALSLIFATARNAYPIINFNYRESTLTLSQRGLETKEASRHFYRAQINYEGVTSEKSKTNINNFAMDPSTVQLKKRSKRVEKQQIKLKTAPEVIPKDPNSFFHPASLNNFKSSVASFKAWQHLHVVPDTHKLAQDKAQDVAAEIDTFIEKFSTASQTHSLEGIPN